VQRTDLERTPGVTSGGGQPLLGASQRWLGVEFRHLGALSAVAREGSFRRAAERLGYVQSAISSQIAQLEKAVGEQLIDRAPGTTGATLTPAGRALLAHVDEILGRFEAARIDLNALADGPSQTVRISLPEGVGQARLPPLVGAFRAIVPDGRLIVEESFKGDDCFSRLTNGELDLLITELPVPAGPFDYTLLERDPYVAIVAADSPLARDLEPPSAERLGRLPLILSAPTRRDDPLRARLRDAGLDRPPWLQPPTVAGAQALAGEGLGVVVAPRLAAIADDPRTLLIELGSLIPARALVLVTHRERERTAAVQALIDVVDSGFAAPDAD
jgi:DNA-binding transcriptional LysR family regulator